MNPRNLEEGVYTHKQTDEQVTLQQVDDGTYVHTQDGKCFAIGPEQAKQYTLLESKVLGKLRPTRGPLDGRGMSSGPMPYKGGY